MSRDPYATLGIPADADDAAIRARYLELVREFPPEHHAERSATIRAAYDRVKTLEDRVKLRLAPDDRDDSLDALMQDLLCTMPRPRPGLTHLLKALPPG